MLIMGVPKKLQLILERPRLQKKILLNGLLLDYFYRTSDNRMAGTSLMHLYMFEELDGRNTNVPHHQYVGRCGQRNPFTLNTLSSDN